MEILKDTKDVTKMHELFDNYRSCFWCKSLFNKSLSEKVLMINHIRILIKGEGGTQLTATNCKEVKLDEGTVTKTTEV